MLSFSIIAFFGIFSKFCGKNLTGSLHVDPHFLRKYVFRLGEIQKRATIKVCSLQEMYLAQKGNAIIQHRPLCSYNTFANGEWFSRFSFFFKKRKPRNDEW